MVTIAPCPDKGTMVEAEIDRVLTQYRESSNLLYTMRTYLGQVVDVITSICDLPSFFDLDTAVGHQLTLLGQRLGWPRCHCICATQPVFGFDCTGYPSGYIVSGFCDDAITWLACGPFGSSDICIDGDEIYRTFLKARRYQMLGLYSHADLTAALQHLWGPTAMVLDDGNGRVVLAPGRELTQQESILLQLVPRVLPVAPGILQRFYFGAVPVFGFGEGWGGFCGEIAPASLIFSEDETTLLGTDETHALLLAAVTEDAPWMCEVDVHPYECAA